MNYLLDTCVVSELIKPKAERRVLEWVNGRPEHRLHLSVLTLGELHKGIARLDASPRRRQLEKWLAEDVRKRFAGRIVVLDEATAASLIDSIADHYRDGAVIVISHRGEDLRRATRRVTMLEGEPRDDHRRFERSRREVM